MSRESLCNDWQQALARCESCAAEAPPRYQWLYQVRARIYRILLAMYGGKRCGDWNVPCSTQDDEPSVFVADSIQTTTGEFSGRPPKSNGEILKVLKHVADANPGVPAGDFTRDDVLRQPQLVADVSRTKDVARITLALDSAGINYSQRRQGNHLQFLVAFADRKAARAAIVDFRHESSREHVRTAREIRRISRVFNRTVLFISGVMILGIVTAYIFGTLMHEDGGSFAIGIPMAIISALFGIGLLFAERFVYRRRIALERRLRNNWPSSLP